MCVGGGGACVHVFVRADMSMSLYMRVHVCVCFIAHVCSREGEALIIFTFLASSTFYCGLILKARGARLYIVCTCF